jgi:hypothetical protein
LAGAAGPVSGAASLDGAAVVASLPCAASSPGLSTPARVVISDLLGAADGAAHGNRIGSRIGVAPFDPTAELAARAAEHAIVLAARDSELASLREQYDHLTVLYQDTRAGPIDVDGLGATRTCALPGCERRAWPSHNYCVKQHAIQAGALGASAGTKFPSFRYVFPPPDCSWGGDRAAGSVFDGDYHEDTMGVSAPPLPLPGTFGRGDPASPFTGLSVEWDRWRLTDIAKAKAFSKHDWEALAGFQTAGRIAEALLTNLDFVASSLEVDSEAAAVLCQVQDAIVSLVESLQRSTDRYTLRWTHSAERFEAFQLFSQLYESQTSGPKCMYPGNIALQHQVALADLKSCKAALSKSAARGGGGDGTSRRSNNAGRRYTQQTVASCTRRAWRRRECFRCQARRRCRRCWRPFVMTTRGRARRGVSFLSSTSAIDINQNVAPSSLLGGGGMRSERYRSFRRVAHSTSRLGVWPET